MDLRRKKALPWYGDEITESYSLSKEFYNYADKFIQLIIESYHAYLAGCPRAAIIIAGEALFQAICYKIVKELEKRGRLIIQKNKNKIELSSDNIKHLYSLYEEISFNDALTLIKQEELYVRDIT